MDILKGGARPSVLIVEDDENLLFVLQYLLKRENYTIESAADGRVALEKINVMPPPAVALLDCTLPFVDGIQLVEQIRQKPGWKDVPVVMLVPKSQVGSVPQALDAGANDYILKPFLPNELVSHLRLLFKPAAEISLHVVSAGQAIVEPAVSSERGREMPVYAEPDNDAPAFGIHITEPVDLLPLIREAA